MQEQKIRQMPFYSKTYSLVDELKKHDFAHKKILTQQDCSTLRTILKKDLDITMRDLSEDNKMFAVNSMNLSFFGCMKK